MDSVSKILLTSNMYLGRLYIYSASVIKKVSTDIFMGLFVSIYNFPDYLVSIYKTHHRPDTFLCGKEV